MALDEAFEVGSTGLNIHGNHFLLEIGVAHNDHYVGTGGELVDERGKLLVLDHHGLELVVGLDAAQLELLDNVRNLLEPVNVLVVYRVVVRDHQEGRPLKQHDLVCIHCFAEFLEAEFQLLDVRQQDRHDGGPGLVEGFVPDRGFEALSLRLEVGLRALNNRLFLLLEDPLSGALLNQVHLVDETENFSLLAEVVQSRDAGVVVS